MALQDFKIHHLISRKCLQANPNHSNMCPSQRLAFHQKTKKTSTECNSVASPWVLMVLEDIRWPERIQDYSWHCLAQCWEYSSQKQLYHSMHLLDNEKRKIDLYENIQIWLHCKHVHVYLRAAPQAIGTLNSFIGLLILRYQKTRYFGEAQKSESVAEQL